MRALSLLMFLLSGASSAAAALPPAEAATELIAEDEAGVDDPFADVGAIEAAEVSVASTDSGPDHSPTAVFGKLHPLVLHFPIAWLGLWALLELILLLRRDSPLIMVRASMAGLTVLSFVPAIATGLVRAQGLDEPDPQVLNHRNLVLAATAFVLLAAGAASIHRTARLTPAFVWVAMVILGLGAHIGGRLVYGDNYLPF